MGRPTKYSEECVQALEHALSMGATREIACRAAGICQESLTRWSRSKVGFVDRIQKAEARAAVRWLEVIDAAADEHWQAAAWKLERRYPAEYGRRQRVDLRIDLRREAEAIAAELGLSADEVLAEAERIVAGAA